MLANNWIHWNFCFLNKEDCLTLREKLLVDHKSINNCFFYSLNIITSKFCLCCFFFSFYSLPEFTLFLFFESNAFFSVVGFQISIQQLFIQFCKFLMVLYSFYGAWQFYHIMYGSNNFSIWFFTSRFYWIQNHGMVRSSIEINPGE